MDTVLMKNVAMLRTTICKIKKHLLCGVDYLLYPLKLQ